MNIKGAIFDMDGTLVDSMSVFNSKSKEYIERLGLSGDEELLHFLMTNTAADVAQKLLDEYNRQESKQAIITEINGMFLDAYTNSIKLKNGVREYLQYLKNSGTKIALLTASDRELAVPCLERNGILDFFDEIVICSEHNSSKKEEKIFFDTARLLNSKPEKTMVFEDALYAVRTAKKAGFKICGVYDEWCSGDWNEIKSLCDLSINDFSELL